MKRSTPFPHVQLLFLVQKVFLLKYIFVILLLYWTVAVRDGPERQEGGERVMQEIVKARIKPLKMHLNLPPSPSPSQS